MDDHPRTAGLRRNQYLVTLPEETRAELHTLIGSGAAPARVLLKANQGTAGLDRGRHRRRRRRDPRKRVVTEGLAAALYCQPPERVYHREAEVIVLVQDDLSTPRRPRCTLPPAIHG